MEQTTSRQGAPLDPTAGWPGGPQPSQGHVTLCCIAAGASSRLPPTPGFFKQQEVECTLTRTQNTGGETTSTLLSHRGCRAETPTQGSPPHTARHVTETNKDWGRHSGPPRCVAAAPTLEAASPSVLSGAEARTYLHLCKYGFRGAWRLCMG